MTNSNFRGNSRQGHAFARDLCKIRKQKGVGCETPGLGAETGLGLEAPHYGARDLTAESQFVRMGNSDKTGWPP